MSTAITAWTLAEAAAALARGEVSAADLTAASLERAAATQPAINSFIAIDADGAQAAARASDERRARGAALSPLDGIPLAHKDLFYRAGRVCSAGSRLFADRRADHTATALARLDAAGAVDLGPLHMAEFAAGGTGHNRHYGDCRNPWDTARTPGGSSSGSGAALAARAVFGSLGSDTGGSIRLPSHFCGVTGLRPTYGRVSRYGVVARSWSADAVGPMARTVEDAALLLQAIAGADRDDPTAERVAVPDYRAALDGSLRGRRLGVARRFFGADLDPAIRRLLDGALAVFRAAGARVVEVDTPDHAPLFAFAQIIAKAEAAALHAVHIREHPGEFDHGIREEMEGGFLLSAVDYIQALRHRGPAAAAFLAEGFAQVDALFTPVLEFATPTMAAIAPTSGAAAAHVMANFGRCTRPFSYLGLPALAVPCGFQPDGMPAAFQLVGRPFDEATVLHFGHAYQRDTDWHRRAPAVPGVTP